MNKIYPVSNLHEDIAINRFSATVLHLIEDVIVVIKSVFVLYTALRINTDSCMFVKYFPCAFHYGLSCLVSVSCMRDAG